MKGCTKQDDNFGRRKTNIGSFKEAIINYAKQQILIDTKKLRNILFDVVELKIDVETAEKKILKLIK